jgi:hypothetical protein
VGRVVGDGAARLDAGSLQLEGSLAASQGHRVRLDLNQLPDFRVFSGQARPAPALARAGGRRTLRCGAVACLDLRQLPKHGSLVSAAGRQPRRARWRPGAPLGTTRHAPARCAHARGRTLARYRPACARARSQRARSPSDPGLNPVDTLKRQSAPLCHGAGGGRARSEPYGRLPGRRAAGGCAAAADAGLAGGRAGALRARHGCRRRPPPAPVAWRCSLEPVQSVCKVVVPCMPAAAAQRCACAVRAALARLLLEWPSPALHRRLTWACCEPRSSGGHELRRACAHRAARFRANLHAAVRLAYSNQQRSEQPYVGRLGCCRGTKGSFWAAAAQNEHADLGQARRASAWRWPPGRSRARRTARTRRWTRCWPGRAARGRTCCCCWGRSWTRSTRRSRAGCWRRALRSCSPRRWGIGVWGKAYGRVPLAVIECCLRAG